MFQIFNILSDTKNGMEEYSIKFHRQNKHQLHSKLFTLNNIWKPTTDPNKIDLFCYSALH